MSSSRITPSKVFAHLDRLEAWKRGEKPAPVTIEWDLSNRCYLGCQSCHFAHTHTKGPWTRKNRVLPTAYDSTGDLADPVLVKHAIREMAEAGVRGIVFTGGGEPTTHPDWLELAEEAHLRGLDVGMYTAGGLISEEKAEKFAHIATWVVVSLDACDRETYQQEKGVDGFDRACQAVSALSLEYSATVGVSYLLHAKNWHRASEMLALARELGATYTTFRPTIETSPDNPAVCTVDRQWITDAFGEDPNSGRESTLRQIAQEPDVELDIQRYYDYRDWSGRSYATCHGIKLNATVTPDGRVWVCPQRRGVEGSEIGDLRKESFQKLWSRHVGQWTDFSQCRVMCRLHLVNQVLQEVYAPMQHEAFV